VPRLRYYLIQVANVPLALLEASDSPVAEGRTAKPVEETA
jgi:hypothetical protein